MSSRLAGYVWSGACGAHLSIAVSSLASGGGLLTAWCIFAAAGSAAFAVACYRAEKAAHPLARTIRRVK